MKQIINAVIVSSLVCAGTAFAHPNHDADDPMSAKRSVPTKAAKHTVEAVSKDGTTRVSITKEGAKVSTANAVGILVSEGKGPRTEYVLQPGGDNVLVTRDKVNLPPGTHATVSVSLADRSKVQEEVTLR